MISIIIPTRGENLESIPTIKSCLAQLCQTPFEIILVSNQENIDLKKEVSKYSKIKYLVAPGKGANISRNFGASFARGELLFFLDDDCILTSTNHLTQLWNCYLSHPEIDLFGGPYISPSPSNYLVSGYNNMVNYWSKSHDYKVAPGGNLWVKKTVFEKIKFNNQLLYGGTELEFILNCQSDYKFLYFKDLGVKHNPNLNIKKTALKSFKQGYAKSSFKHLKPKRITVRPYDYPFLLFYGIFSKIGELSGKASTLADVLKKRKVPSSIVRPTE